MSDEPMADYEPEPDHFGIGIGTIVFYMITFSGLDRFPHDAHTFQTIVRELRSDQRFAQLLEPLVFSAIVDVYPFSRLLDGIRNSMMFGGLIAPAAFPHDFPTGEFEVNPKVRARMLKRAERTELLGEHVDIIRELGQAFAEAVIAAR